MDKQPSTGSKAAWAGTVTYLAITALHAWYLHAFIPVAGLVFLSFIGGILLYFALKSIVVSLIKPPINGWSIIAGLFLSGLGILTLIPGWPDSWLLGTPIGLPILEERIRSLDRAMYGNRLQRVRKIAWAGVGDPEPRDTFGRPLIDDAKTPEMLRILIHSGLNPDARGEGGVTLLMRTRDTDMARTLLAGGADPNARDDNGRTPLMHVANASLEMVKILAESGADVNAVDDYGRTVADWMGDHPEIEKVLSKYAHGGIRRSANLDFLSHARRDWLDPLRRDGKHPLKPSAISVSPDPMTYGDLADIHIRLSNDSDTDRVLKVAANLNAEALFVEASHEGKIINPYQPRLNQEIGWPLLALPAQRSGTLRMRIIARNAWDAGDLSVDVRARNALNPSEEETIFLNLYRTLSKTTGTWQSVRSWFVVIIPPLAIMIWLCAWRFLGREHSVTRGTGRFVAGMFSMLFALLVYSNIMELVRPYTQFDKSEALILDRRYYLESTTTTGSDRGGRSSTTIYRVPIVAARYTTSHGEIISSGQASFQFFRDHKLGAVVPCWYDRDNPGEFMLERNISLFSILFTVLMAMSCPVLAWSAVRRRKNK